MYEKSIGKWKETNSEHFKGLLHYYLLFIVNVKCILSRRGCTCKPFTIITCLSIYGTENQDFVIRIHIEIQPKSLETLLNANCLTPSFTRIPYIKFILEYLQNLILGIFMLT